MRDLAGTLADHPVCQLSAAILMSIFYLSQVISPWAPQERSNNLCSWFSVSELDLWCAVSNMCKRLTMQQDLDVDSIGIKPFKKLIPLFTVHMRLLWSAQISNLTSLVRLILHETIYSDRARNSFQMHNTGIVPCLFGITGYSSKLSDCKIFVCYNSPIIY